MVTSITFVSEQIDDLINLLLSVTIAMVWMNEWMQLNHAGTELQGMKFGSELRLQVRQFLVPKIYRLCISV